MNTDSEGGAKDLVKMLGERRSETEFSQSLFFLLSHKHKIQLSSLFGCIQFFLQFVGCTTQPSAIFSTLPTSSFKEKTRTRPTRTRSTTQHPRSTTAMKRLLPPFQSQKIPFGTLSFSAWSSFCPSLSLRSMSCTIWCWSVRRASPSSIR